MSSEGSSSSSSVMDRESFLLVASQIESKLRNPFTSLDLAATIEREADPISFLRNLDWFIFDPTNSSNHTKMDKLVKLRVLISLLGLESTLMKGTNDDKTNNVSALVWNILNHAQQQAPDDEEWTRMVAGIVQGKLYYDDDDNDSNTNTNNTREQTEYKSLLQKNNEHIIQQTLQSFSTSTIHNNANQKPCEENYYYAPIRYHLLDPPILKAYLPELYDSHNHFLPSLDCDILQLDSRAEQIRAAEEEKAKEKELLEQKRRSMEEKKKILLPPTRASTEVGQQRQSQQPQPNSGVRNGTTTTNSKPQSVGVKAGVTKPTTTAAAAVSNTSTSFLRTGFGRGRLAALSTASSSTTSGSGGGNRVLGRGMSAAAKAALRDKSRGMGTTTTTTNNTATTTSPITTTILPPSSTSSSTTTTNNHKDSERLVSDTSTSLIAAAAPPTTSAIRGRAAALLNKGGRSGKMKVMDPEEAKQNLIRVSETSSIEDSRAQRKRKLMEEAEARGLKKSSIKKL